MKAKTKRIIGRSMLLGPPVVVLIAMLADLGWVAAVCFVGAALLLFAFVFFAIELTEAKDP